MKFDKIVVNDIKVTDLLYAAYLLRSPVKNQPTFLWLRIPLILFSSG
jgi:hypothetical protein